MTDERSGVHLGHLDLGSGFALVQHDDSGRKATVFKRGVRFSGVSDDLVSKREHVSRGRLSEPVEAA
jgi:hypothetical protein